MDKAVLDHRGLGVQPNDLLAFGLVARDTVAAVGDQFLNGEPVSSSRPGTQRTDSLLEQVVSSRAGTPWGMTAIPLIPQIGALSVTNGVRKIIRGAGLVTFPRFLAILGFVSRPGQSARSGWLISSPTTNSTLITALTRLAGLKHVS
jgi:hypothetical protein